MKINKSREKAWSTRPVQKKRADEGRLRSKRAWKTGLNLAELLFGVLCVIYYGICRYTAGSQISILAVWLYMGCILIIKSCFCICRNYEYRKYYAPLILLFDLLFTVFFVSSSVFTSGVLYNMKNPSPKNCDYLFILGASVNGDVPSNVLQKRIDKAYEYLNRHPDTMAVCTGGLGPGDRLSEGRCSASVLAAMGIMEDRILIEEQSTTTAENIRLGLDKISGQPECIGIVSSNFHVFRAKLTMKSFTNAEVEGIGASFSGVLLPHYILREYLTFLIDLSLGNIRLF